MSDPGVSFGAAAAEYDRARPEWPPELLDPLPVAPEATVVDVGAGTGKLTRLLAERYGRVVAVEPDERMRALIKGVEVVGSSAEVIPLDDGSVDAVFAAESFHWFESEAAVGEFARILRTSGVLALLWNRFDPDDYALPAGVLPESTTPKQTLFSSGEWRRAFAGAPFEEFRERRVVQERIVTRSELLEYFASVSPITALEPCDRQAALARVAAALDAASYRRRWTAMLYWTRRK